MYLASCLSVVLLGRDYRVTFRVAHVTPGGSIKPKSFGDNFTDKSPCDVEQGKRMRTGVELTRSQKEKEQREESKADESPPPDAHPKELQRRPVLALALVSFAAVAATANQDTGTQ